MDVSSDGRSWTTIGTATASNRTLDLGALNEVKFVRLIDKMDSRAGSRIDAIGVVQVRPYK